MRLFSLPICLSVCSQIAVCTFPDVGIVCEVSVSPICMSAHSLIAG